jgi:Na+-driven multidrug efflux pump
MTVGSFLTGLEKATESIVIMLVESVILPLILILVLTKIIGVYGIFVVPSISGVISVIIAFILWRKTVKGELRV